MVRQARADNLTDPAFLHRLRQAGCWMRALGIESESDDVRKNMVKRLERQKIRTAFRNMRDAGIKSFAFFIYGGAITRAKRRFFLRPAYVARHFGDIVKLALTKQRIVWQVLTRTLFGARVAPAEPVPVTLRADTSRSASRVPGPKVGSFWPGYPAILGQRGRGTYSRNNASRHSGIAATCEKPYDSGSSSPSSIRAARNRLIADE